jgi:hypothetical protein
MTSDREDRDVIPEGLSCSISNSLGSSKPTADGPSATLSSAAMSPRRRPLDSQRIGGQELSAP